MSRVMALLKDRKVWWALLFICFVLIPLSLVYVAWLIDFRWWSAEEWMPIKEKGYYSGDMEERFENIDQQLRDMRCPARLGLELKDYWECLWRTSITSEGRRQHDQFLWEDYVDRVDRELEGMEGWLNGTRKRGKRSVRKLLPIKLTPKNYGFFRSYFLNADTLFPLLIAQKTAQEDPQGPPTLRKVRACQQGILPGESIYDFLLCIRKISLTIGSPILEYSFDPTFQPTTFPPISQSEYDTNDMPLISLNNTRTGSEYKLSFDFVPLGKEEGLNDFLGGDPYFDDNWSVYRYRYNNLKKDQRNPGWSYRGADGSKEWHDLNLERFLLPLKKSAKLEKAAFLADLAQTYPGIGEIAEFFEEEKTPLDYRWNKDAGYNVFTRFLLPVLTEEDLDYYKKKGLIKESVTEKPDAEQIQEIIDELQSFKANSTNFIERPPPVGVHTLYQSKKDKEIPFAKVYFEFMTHFFHMDTKKYLEDKKKAKKDPNARLTSEMETVRLLLHSYIEAVLVQEHCIKNMLKQSDHRIEDTKELEQLVKDAKDSGKVGCLTVSSRENAIKDDQYKVVEKDISYLYDAYFDRKEARQRYSLPKYPVEYPVCKHNEPSPIDIKTNRGRRSSLRDYTFGPAAYRLNRFFMFFPLDGVPLLTVGIKDGERLDGSSVSLTGGAVKGQNLTFQYMHIRFGQSWTSVGSEHWIDGKGAPVELQMVFTIAGSADPIKYWHVLARMHNQLFQFREKLVVVLSVLVDVLATDKLVEDKIEKEKLNQDPYVFETLAQAAYHFRSIPRKYPTYEEPRGYVSADPVFRFIDFLPHKSGKFYTYRGSLSWPPCFGYVIWSVYQQRLYMSKRQFDQFAEIPAYGIQSHNLANENFRRFEDIWVEEEKEPSLTYNQIEDMVRFRTDDRHFLIGTHDVNEEGGEQEGGVVGEEMYYRVVEDKSVWNARSYGRLVAISLVVQLIMFFYLQNVFIKH